MQIFSDLFNLESEIREWIVKSADYIHTAMLSALILFVHAYRN